jgi:Protein of unknown function (DUF3631)
MRTLLLSDIRGVFRDKKVDRIKSETVAMALASMTDRPWPTFDKGKWITPAGIARMLRPYGYRPRDNPVRRGDCEGLPPFRIRRHVR